MKNKNRKIYFDKQPTLPLEEWEDNFGQTSDKAPHANSDLAVTGEDTSLDRLHFISFGSGSSGNSCYIGTRHGGIVIDAGIRADIIEETLNRHGVNMRHVKGLLLTHDHSDHIRFSYNLLRNNRHLSVFCTPRVLNGLLRRHNISKRIKEYHTPIFKEIPFKIAGMEITAFEVPHDGSDNMGFSIEYGTNKFVLATDLGTVAERARHYMSQANYLVIESNYDADMLRYGRYPEYLKSRIRASNGHLDNRDTAEFLCSIVNPRLKYVFLCHLSQDNNTPEKALSTIREALRAKGISIGNGEETLEDKKCDLQLLALPRFDATRWFVL